MNLTLTSVAPLRALPSRNIERSLPILPERPTIPTSLTALRHATSFRRHLLDAHLAWISPLMRGVVIDLGGKRERVRGAFRPPAAPGTTWTYVNIDAATAPDLLCDVTHVPLPAGVADCVVCTEVLEHLPDPVACVNEANRLLRPGGMFVSSVPFLYPVHADPYDFNRFTADGLRLLHAGFSTVRVMSMGGYLGSLGMFVEHGARHVESRHIGAKAIKRILFETGRLLQWQDARRGASGSGEASPAFTTGYFVIALK